MASSLPYHEPSVETLLILASFLLTLNVVNYIFDAFLYCGLVGQIIVGIAWGTPGGKLLSASAEEFIAQLGYIGLILIVFEGGLSTSLKALKANLLLSVGVALTGISAPIALSFTLRSIAGADSLQAFSAGAALCSTSLGTTFTLLSSSGLGNTRLGVVLTSAAMMDDVVGLIMVRIVTNLGSTSGTLDAVTVIQPVFVSLGFVMVVPLACRFILLPFASFMARIGDAKSWFRVLLAKRETCLTVHTFTLIGLVAATTYAGSSGLLGAYIAGATISWWDAEVSHTSQMTSRPGQGEGSTTSEPVEEPTAHRVVETHNWLSRTASITSLFVERDTSGMKICELYYRPTVERLLKPFFFASVGFSIPITRMFSGPIVWRGIIYALLMSLGKLLCGLWLVRLPSPWERLQRLASITKYLVQRPAKAKDRSGSGVNRPEPMVPSINSRSGPESTTLHRPICLYPGLILGCAMIARGEIGYLISSLAEAHGTFDNSGRKETPDPTRSEGPSDLFLITTWAITLCTIAGPVCMGILVCRLKRLDKGRDSDHDQGSPRAEQILGAWGVG